MNVTTFAFTLRIKAFLLLLPLLFSGCASVMLSDSNEKFERRHQRTIEFAPSVVSADYLGKVEGACVYKALDSKKSNRDIYVAINQ